jgi:MtN3 and saliva related transmembrane protein
LDQAIFWYLFGTLAAVLTTFGFVPQIIKMQRTRSSKDVSLATLYQFSAGVILWTLYGFHIGDVIIIVANIICFLTLVVAIGFYHYYASK